VSVLAAWIGTNAHSNLSFAMGYKTYKYARQQACSHYLTAVSQRRRSCFCLNLIIYNIAGE